MKKTTTELGKVIAVAREKVGISQRELARRANMDCAEISRIEAGKRLKPNVLYLKGIAETLNFASEFGETAKYSFVTVDSEMIHIHPLVKEILRVGLPMVKEAH